MGRLAQRKASETPGRVAQSAKSWLCHHAADRSTPFLPWGSDALAQQDKISPVDASALILAHLRAAWNARFAGQGSDFAFDAQDITITVPASFDAAAQRLTLAAAQQAGFPDHVCLLEEPQAAFYWWLEQQAGRSDPWRALPNPQSAARHVLVIDVGGGTSDFSLFELSRHEGSRDLGIKRVAVSDHILLGGDNIDLAIAHLLEPRLATGEGGLSVGQWDHLVARCRSLKERVLGCEAAPDEVFTVSIPGRGSSLFAGSLSAQVTRAEPTTCLARPSSTRHEERKAGDVVELVPEEFHALPPLETAAAAAEPARGELASAIPVALNARVNELGLLQVSCRSLAPDIPQSWPLEFNLRPHERDLAAPAREPKSQTQAEPTVAPDALAGAGRRIGAAFTQSSGKGEKLTAPRLFQSLEQILGRSKGDWNAILLRDVWTSLEASQTGRALSVEHEETWLILAGFLLRPGFGVAMDEGRIDGLWRIRGDGLRFPGKRTKLQEYILWRRVAGGLSRERQEILLAGEKDKIGQPKSVSPELIRMAGSFERIGHELKAELIGRFIETVVELASQQKHCAPYLAALGLLLNRTPFYAGPESVVPPVLVERAYEAFRRFDWNDPEFAEAQVLFLRAARAVDDRRLDLSKSLRNQIADKLEKCKIAPIKAGRLRNVVPVERAEQLSLYGEAVPPGLILGED